MKRLFISKKWVLSCSSWHRRSMSKWYTLSSMASLSSLCWIIWEMGSAPKCWRDSRRWSTGSISRVTLRSLFARSRLKILKNGKRCQQLISTKAKNIYLTKSSLLQIMTTRLLNTTYLSVVHNQLVLMDIRTCLWAKSPYLIKRANKSKCRMSAWLK